MGRVHVLDARGHGHLPPVVLLHGIQARRRSTSSLCSAGCRGEVRRLIAPDLPAHGFSDRPAEMTAATLRDALVEALDAVIDEPAVVFGNSLGGVAAVHYALARPERVRGLILCSPGGAMMDAGELQRFVDTFALDTHDAALAFVDRLFSRRNPYRHLFAWGVRRQFENPDVRELLNGTSPADLLTPEQLAALRMPVAPPLGPRRAHPPPPAPRLLPPPPPRAGPRSEEPEGFGHAPYLDDVDGVARRILAFYLRASPSRARAVGQPPPRCLDLHRRWVWGRPRDKGLRRGLGVWGRFCLSGSRPLAAPSSVRPAPAVVADGTGTAALTGPVGVGIREVTILSGLVRSGVRIVLALSSTPWSRSCACLRASSRRSRDEARGRGWGRACPPPC